MAIQIIDENREPSIGERFGQAFANLGQTAGQMIPQYLQGKRENEQLQNLLGRDVSGLSPDMKKLAFQYGMESQNKQKEMALKLQGNERIIRGLEKQYNLKEGELQDFIQNPEIAEKVLKPTKKTQASQPIDPDQISRIKAVRENPEFKEASPLKKYQMMTDAGVSKENAQAEADIAAKETDIQQKGFDAAYKANEDFINETTSKYEGFETEMKPRLMQMQAIPDEDLVSPTAAVFLEELGIPLGALEDPSSELYQKLSQDLLKGLPETYGNRILKVEVDNFLKTIPTLMNSADGRRMIASNMLKLGEMKEVYYNEMRRQQQSALDSGKFPRDFQQKVFDQVKPQIDRINNEFVKMAEIKKVPPGTIPFFNPSGEIEFVPKEHAQWAQNNGGRRIW